MNGMFFSNNLDIAINHNLFAEIPMKLCERFINDDVNPLIKYETLHGSTIIRFADSDSDSHQNYDKKVTFCPPTYIA